MKKALLTLAALALAGSSYAQGLITFAHFASGKEIKAYTGANADSTITVGLFLSSNLNTPLATTTIFQNTGLFQFDGSDVVVPGVPAGSTADLTIRAWNTSAGSYDSAKQLGQTGEGRFTSLALGGVNPNPPPPALTAPDLTGFQGFQMVNNVPEPATIALGAIGVGALLLRRRK